LFLGRGGIATSGAGIAFPSGAPEVPRFLVVFVLLKGKLRKQIIF
jgi:hypothetical protein